MKRHNLFAALTINIALMCSAAYAELNVDFNAKVLSSTCKMEIDNNGIINLATVGLDYFANSTTAEQYYTGGKNFSILLSGCSGTALTGTKQLHLDFKPRTGSFAPGSSQIFPNEDINGASNIGIVIFSVNDSNNKFNVWSPAGVSRSVYAIDADKMNDSRWNFYTRMQKVNNAASVGSGKVTTSVLVDAWYE
ncbi:MULTISPECIES: fimbrial-like protein [Escherichia]|nr:MULTISPECIES: fimbrial-like protein [Escherichia]EFB3348654.1 fimbrial protein [Escherichia coli]EJH3420987.1 fimbrial protein [Escherichia coli]MDR4879965.1 fimbrial-like protein [Escherichia ruysiae]MDR4908788.1 fimbrial-like protein [Escherichia ruysiae]MDR4964307.1 fimbrial-like protein [Escherichia ruysiae]